MRDRTMMEIRQSGSDVHDSRRAGALTLLIAAWLLVRRSAAAVPWASWYAWGQLVLNLAGFAHGLALAQALYAKFELPVPDAVTLICHSVAGLLLSSIPPGPHALGDEWAGRAGGSESRRCCVNRTDRSCVGPRGGRGRDTGIVGPSRSVITAQRQRRRT